MLACSHDATNLAKRYVIVELTMFSLFMFIYTHSPPFKLLLNCKFYGLIIFWVQLISERIYGLKKGEQNKYINKFIIIIILSLFFLLMS